MKTEQPVAVITGASQGIGAGLVAAYRNAGWRVVANSRSMPQSNDPDILTIAGDISEPDTAERILVEGIDRFGRVDTLINNAGVFTGKSFTDFTLSDWSKNIGTNLAGFFHVTQRVIRLMERQGAGHIVQITTSLVDHPMNGVPSALASLTKGGLNAVTKSLAIEFAGRGIRANAVSLGVIKTPMHAAETYASLAKLHPIGRMGEIDEVVDAVMFLERSPFITGEILHVDGGQSAGR